MQDMEEKHVDDPVSVSFYKEVKNDVSPIQSVENDNHFACPYFSVARGRAFSMGQLLERKPPLRLSFLQLAVLTKGWSEPVVNFRKLRVDEGDLFCASWGGIIGRGSEVSALCYDGVSLTEEYMRVIYGGRLPDLFLQPAQAFKLRLTKRERAVFSDYIDSLLSLVRLPTPVVEPVNALFVSLLDFVATLYLEQEGGAIGGGKSLLRAFNGALIKHVKREHSVLFYARELCISPHYLGDVVKAETGETAKEWIDRSLITLLQMELKNSDKSLKELVGEFNFNSISTLSRFFKRKTGMSPSEFRLSEECLRPLPTLS